LDDVDSSIDDEFPFAPLTLLLQAAVAFEHRNAAQALAARLSCVAHLPISDSFCTCVGRHLGDAAALVGDRTTAAAYYAQALEAAGKVRFRPEVALAHLSMAELLLEEDDSEALKHLGLAIPELRDMRMQPALDRGLSLLERINRRAPSAVSESAVSQVLTGREQEVARLLAAGLSNREIADVLVITEGTAEVHVKHILSKLGLRSRAQVGVWAADERV
jgi:DNA-binding CsgD family transcriptional regulator